MIKINLLPHREEKRKARRRDFYVMAGLSFAAAVVIVIAVGVVIDTMIANQQERNDFIKAENVKLDEQIKQIATLRQEIDALKARQQAVENLQSDRNLPVHLLDELLKQMPEGVFLKSVVQQNLKVSLDGYAQSNERVAEVLRALGNNSAWLESPELLEIKATNFGKDSRRVYEFTMNVNVKRPKDKDASGNDPKATPSAPAK